MLTLKLARNAQALRPRHSLYSSFQKVAELWEATVRGCLTRTLTMEITETLILCIFLDIKSSHSRARILRSAGQRRHPPNSLKSHKTCPLLQRVSRALKNESQPLPTASLVFVYDFSFHFFGVGTRATVHVCPSEDNLREPVLCFHLVGPGLLIRNCLSFWSPLCDGARGEVGEGRGMTGWGDGESWSWHSCSPQCFPRTCSPPSSAEARARLALPGAQGG